MKYDLHDISLLLIYYKPTAGEKKNNHKARGKPPINTLKLFHCKNSKALCKDNTSKLLEVT